MPVGQGEHPYLIIIIILLLLIFGFRKQPAFGHAWAVSKPGPNAMWGVLGLVHGSE